ncbi:hydroxymethylglutaryl-CoA synthase [Methanosarcinales archaeon ex4484_138]|nr:MAG: hydroxymethylglutaryl-CoA synthase [Methanosarcinales archaeon ex4484_138]
MDSVGIVSYGVYIPRYRIKVDEIAETWGEDADSIRKGLWVFEKSVPDIDEDAVTIAVEAARNAIGRRDMDPLRIEAIYTGSESHPYVVKPTSTIVAEAIGATPSLTAADFEFACKAGTAAIQACMGLVGAGMIDLGLAIGSDVAQGAPGDALEYTAAAGGVAFIIGRSELIAEIKATCSLTTDMPDFWRRDGMPYPEHGGRFTGEPAYFKHIIGAAGGLMEKTSTTPKDYDYVVFHQPNGKFPMRAAATLGFTEEQLGPGFVVPHLGNTYSGSAMMGLAAVLDVAEPGERILMASFGSGAGSDAFEITVLDEIEELRGKAPSVSELLERPTYISYATYARHKGKMKI